ncbi:MAG: hypothetical protein COA33_008095 [Fluviicola sp.]|nr:hypothetical protein [Fluviicola sp.]
MEATFKFSKTYRYQILNENANATTVLYVLHGYGQLVKFFIQKFKELDSPILVVAPEGMHRFYRNGNAGRVGASWMTKEARETDIADNMGYLTELDVLISKKYPIKNRILLGFSQGASTAIRWKLDKKVAFNSLIVWASDFPPDVVWHEEFYGEKQNYFAIGKNDEFFNAEKTSEVCQQFLSLGYKIEQFEGTHDIETATLKRILKRIAE